MGRRGTGCLVTVTTTSVASVLAPQVSGWTTKTARRPAGRRTNRSRGSAHQTSPWSPTGRPRHGREVVDAAWSSVADDPTISVEAVTVRTAQVGNTAQELRLFAVLGQDLSIYQRWGGIVR